jgi:hypothetical protein
MKRVILALLLVAVIFGVHTAWGAGQQTFLKSQTGDGAVLTLADGSVWEVAPAHRSESAEWRPGDRIVIMESKDSLFNSNQGESVDARLLQPAR